MELKEIGKLADSLSTEDWYELERIMKLKEKPIFWMETYKKYYKLISEFPYLDDNGWFENISIFKLGYQFNILSVEEIRLLESSPFGNMAKRFCLDYHFYKVYNYLYKEGDNFTCPFTDKECKNEDECFDGLFSKLQSYRYVLQRKSDFLETCRSCKIFPSKDYIKQEVSRIAVKLMDIIPINENILYKDSIKHMREQGLIDKDKVYEALEGIDENKPSCGHWYLRPDYRLSSIVKIEEQ